MAEYEELGVALGDVPDAPEPEAPMGLPLRDDDLDFSEHTAKSDGKDAKPGASAEPLGGQQGQSGVKAQPSAENDKMAPSAESIKVDPNAQKSVQNPPPVEPVKSVMSVAKLEVTSTKSMTKTSTNLEKGSKEGEEKKKKKKKGFFQKRSTYIGMMIVGSVVTTICLVVMIIAVIVHFT